jgi:hypothetical protein
MKHIVFLTLLSTLPLSAQWHHFGEARPTGFFGVGATAPVNPAARQLDTGWGFTGGIGVVKQYVGLNLDFMFNDFGLNRATLRNTGATHGSQKFWALTADPVFHVNPRGPIDFYVTAGGGLYSRITTLRAFSGFGGPFGEAEEVRGSFTSYKPGVDGGAGFAFNLGYTNRVKIFVEARYHRMFTSGFATSFVPVTVGVSF